MGTVLNTGTPYTFIDMKKFTGVTTLNNGSYLRNSNVVEVVFPPNVTSVSGICLQGNGKAEVFVISSAPQMGGSTFYGDRKNKAFIFLSATPPTLTSDVFSYSTGKIYVPDGSYDAYHSAAIFSGKTIYTFSQLQEDYPDYYDRFVAN